MCQAPTEFTGYQVHDAKNYTVFKKGNFQAKPFGENDVDVQVECCGVCSSDVHTINGGWGEKILPLAVGHEIVGKAVRVGSKVSLVKVGQRVGVGAQIYSCGECRPCQKGNENYCLKMVDTYGAEWPGSGVISQGGYSNCVRANEWWVYPIPDAIASSDAAPMMCAGITTYSPLAKAGIKAGQKVGIIGLGGLGHFGVLWAKALGAETWVISRSHAKESDALKLGADGFLATGDKDWNKGHELTFDMLICTANNFGEGFDLGGYLGLLDIHGVFNSVGLPEEAELQIRPQMLNGNACSILSTHIGNRAQMLDMLKLAAEKNVKPWVETMPIGEENLGKAISRLVKNDCFYRFTMTDYDKAFA